MDSNGVSWSHRLRENKSAINHSGRRPTAEPIATNPIYIGQHVEYAVTTETTQNPIDINNNNVHRAPTEYNGDPSISRNEKETLSLEEKFILKLDPKMIMKGVPKGFVCYKCESPQNVVTCPMCQRHMHLQCVTGEKLEQGKLQTMVEKKHFKCNECAIAGAKDISTKQKCFVCNDESKEAENEPKCRCAKSLCLRYYHLSCLRRFPQFTTVNFQSIICPYHVCHTCAAEDRRGKSKSLVCCVKCPSSYHPDMDCIPAGTDILTTHQIICPKHSIDRKPPNVRWCILCSQGGELIFCEACPTAFHRNCLPCAVPEGKYLCEECVSGRLPLYNEIVMAKFSTYRWWPGLTIPPSLISEELLRQRPSASFICVKFFQSHTVAWLNRRKIFLYRRDYSQSLDNKNTKMSGTITTNYHIAMDEASKIYKKKKNFNVQLDGTPAVHPPIYKKIKINKYIAPLKRPNPTRSTSTCHCRPEDEDPCGPMSSCINRDLSIECVSKDCPAKKRCSNQRFAKRVNAALDVHHFGKKGYGLVAKESMTSGQFIIEYIGEVINKEEYKRRTRMMQELGLQRYFFFTVEPDMTIDSGAAGNYSRFANHSCEPNCETQKWMVGNSCVIGLFAIRDILPGEELTINYNWESSDNTKEVCLCGAASCSGFIERNIEGS